MSLYFSIDKPLDRNSLLSATLGAFALASAVTLALFLFNIATDGRYIALIISLGIATVMTIGYQIFAGSTGVVSFGHPGFVALGAYSAGLLTVPAAVKATMLPHLPAFIASIETNMVTAIFIGGIAAAVVAALIGPIVMRLSGAAAGIMTFAFLVIMNELLRNADAFTRGNQTFFGVPKLADFPTVYTAVIITAVLGAAFKFSSPGLRARAVSQDPLAAETMGMQLVIARLWPWILSAFVMGCAGALMAFFLTAFSPKSFYTALVIPMMVMAVLGGLNSVAGAVAGTILLTFWEQLMRGLESGGFGIAVPLGTSQLTLGVALVLLLYLRPGGLLGTLEPMIGRTNSRPDKYGKGGSRQ